MHRCANNKPQQAAVKPVHGMPFQAAERATATAVCFQTATRSIKEVGRKEQELLLRCTLPTRPQVQLEEGAFGMVLLDTHGAGHKTSNCRGNDIQQPIQDSSYNASSHSCFFEQVRTMSAQQATKEVKAAQARATIARLHATNIQVMPNNFSNKSVQF
jgi:hypothetical protein